MSAYALMCSKKLLRNHLKLLTVPCNFTENVAVKKTHHFWSHTIKCCQSYDSRNRLGLNSDWSLRLGRNYKEISANIQCQLDACGKKCYSTNEASLSGDAKKENNQHQEKTASQNPSDKEPPKKESIFSSKHAWKWGLGSVVFLVIYIGGIAVYLWGPPKREEDGTEVIDEFTTLPKTTAYLKRTWKEVKFFQKSIQEPTSLKLLPDPFKEPYYQPPYTVVLEMTGVLVHPDWTLGTGWRFKKRPEVDEFLQQIGPTPNEPPLFEIVIFSYEAGMTAFPIVDQLDSKGLISYRLFRDSTRYMNKHHVKDLSCLNRDLSKVIFVDCDPKSLQLQPNNGLLLKEWKGNDDDRTLPQLARFLRTIAISGVDDVRPVLEYYNQFDDPLKAFQERQEHLQAEQDKRSQATTQAKTPTGFAGKLSSGFGRR